MIESILIVSAVLIAAILITIVIVAIVRPRGQKASDDTMMTIDRKHTFFTSGKSKSGEQKLVVQNERELFDLPPGL